MADFSKYYRAYMQMQELLKNDFTYNYINESFKDGDKGDDLLDGKTNEKVIDMDWVEAIEEPYLIFKRQSTSKDVLSNRLITLCELSLPKR